MDNFGTSKSHTFGSNAQPKKNKLGLKNMWAKAFRKREKSYADYKEDDWEKMNEKVRKMIDKNDRHQRVFCELEEMVHTEDGELEWKETARWVKFEENVETGADRWSKPHVGTLSLHAFFQLEKHLKSDAVFLDCSAESIPDVNSIIVDYLKGLTNISEDGILEVKEQLAARHSHCAGRKGSKKQQHFGLNYGAEGCLICTATTKHLTERVVCFLRLAKPIERSDVLEVDLPVRFIVHMMGPEKFKNHFHEMGRCFAVLMADDVFHEVAYSAVVPGDILLGMREFLDKSWILPPDEWDPSIRIDPPNIKNQNRRAELMKRRVGQSEGVDFGDGGAKAEEHQVGDELRRTGRLFGGLVGDIKRKKPFFVSDFWDALEPAAILQCLATYIFLFFAIITPIVTFGGLLGDATDNHMAAMESILGGAIAGSLYHLCAGQPLTIIGSTGPILVFETIIYNMCQEVGEQPINYLELRWWIGVWTGLFCFLIVITDGSFCVKYITRYTEESFATLISMIFIVDGMKKLLAVKQQSPVDNAWQLERVLDYSCTCAQPSYSPSDWYDSQIHTADWWEKNASSQVIIEGKNYVPSRTWVDETSYWCLYKNEAKGFALNEGSYFSLSNGTLSECFSFCGELTGAACSEGVFVPNVFYFSFFLGLGTLFLSLLLKAVPSSPFGSSAFRKFIADFAVIIAIVTMILIDIAVGLETPKLSVPHEFHPTRPDRTWIIHPMKHNPAWTIALAIPFAVLATILIFMDQQITAVIVNRRENKLEKGCGYHLDLLVVAVALVVCSLLGLPWFVAATVLSITHVNSLKKFEKAAAPGEAREFNGVYEQRLTGILIFLTIGCSVFFTGLLNKIPLPVLYGVFIYMGISSLRGNQLFDRLRILFMPAKYQPDYVYLRHVPLYKVNLFTAIQLACFTVLWVVKSVKSISIAFPIMVVAIVGVRKAFDFCPKLFTQRELSWLDDVMPHEDRKLEDDHKSNAESMPSKLRKESRESQRTDETNDDTDDEIHCHNTLLKQQSV